MCVGGEVTEEAEKKEKGKRNEMKGKHLSRSQVNERISSKKDEKEERERS